MFRPDSVLKLKFTAAAFAGRQLSVYRSLQNESSFGSFMHLIDVVNMEDPGPEKLLEAYYDLVHNLLGIDVPASFSGNTWQYFLADFILRDENPFSRIAESVPFDKIDAGLKLAAGADLANLYSLAAMDPRTIRHMVKNRIRDQISGFTDIPSLNMLPGWDKTDPNTETTPDVNSTPDDTPELVSRLAVSEDWQSLLPDLADFYRKNGAGIFGSYHALRWVRSKGTGWFQGIVEPDPVTFANLFGYRSERKIIINNTEKLLQGLPANNILLYGDRGTGKSSSVKALLHRFGSMGLRLVEVSKQELADFPKIIHFLRQRVQKFIIFIDDLSFEENDSEYKYLKALLEGGLEAKPQNVLIYATSNRRHLIKERFSDREAAASSDEKRLQDTLQEKLSLADRFGITVTFTSPAQAEYLAIVDGLTKQAGINIPKEELHRQAIQWELRYNGRSGRTARQFVDWLAGEKKKRIF
ncbi:ATP-binding protein [Phosphitispora fastidiosa]|uniref:ATP-binding protein n=1 Tax=Phosphitispora fastidiosa TaxID=2837202 RepID=UPI001E354D47|nr:ATP-binding protein [Phosphitispora fastidiosa]MBU7006160.1 putative AAA+ superfamily ATPase [Phosphitispora fastidiosa]